MQTGEKHVIILGQQLKMCNQSFLVHSIPKIIRNTIQNSVEVFKGKLNKQPKRGSKSPHQVHFLAIERKWTVPQDGPIVNHQ